VTGPTPTTGSSDKPQPGPEPETLASCPTGRQRGAYHEPPAVPPVRSQEDLSVRGTARAALEATALGPGIYDCTVIEQLTSIGWP
jgi:hypothetical protein